MNAKVKLHNRFDFTLVGPDGKVKQVAQAENLVTNNIFKILYYDSSGSKHIVLGDGNGVPAVTDTSLFHQVYSNNCDATDGVQEIAHDTISIQWTLVLPATSEYVYNFTEIGITNGSTLMTHAMIKDSEGNPITIVKTDLDELTVVVTVFAQWGDVPDYIKMGRIRRSGIASWLGAYYYNNGYDGIRACACSCALAATMYPDWLTRLYWYSNDLEYYNWDNGTPGGYYLVNVMEDSKTEQGLMTFNTVRIGKDSFNLEQGMTYINALCFPGVQGSVVDWSQEYMRDFFHVPMPNTKLFSGATLQGLVVGTGDGSTKDFIPYLPVFVKDTEVIKVNGVAMKRGTDYLVDNLHNRQKLYHMSWGHLAEPIQGLSASYAYSMFRYSTGMINDGSTSYSDVFANTQQLAGFSINTPFILKSKNDPLVGNKVNHLSIGGIKTDNSYDGMDLRGVQFIFSYSQDNVQYTEAARITVTEDLATNSSSYKWTAGGWGKEIHLDTPIEAQYWKLSVDVSKATVGTTRTMSRDTVFRSGQGYNSQSGFAIPIRPFIGYVGDYGIRFTNPPTAGAVITMDANVDRPWKDGNHVIDIAAQIQLG